MSISYFAETSDFQSIYYFYNNLKHIFNDNTCKSFWHWNFFIQNKGLFLEIVSLPSSPLWLLHNGEGHNTSRWLKKETRENKNHQYMIHFLLMQYFSWTKWFRFSKLVHNWITALLSMHRSFKFDYSKRKKDTNISQNQTQKLFLLLSSLLHSIGKYSTGNSSILYFH